MKTKISAFHFLHNEKFPGILLILCTLASLTITNSGLGNNYLHFWHFKIGSHGLEGWINDGLMAIFFLLVGLELKREILYGELSSTKKAVLPAIAAVGGMIVPACIYLYFNQGLETQRGAGIPMATDIAFALGVLSLLGNRVPNQLKVLLSALAVIDDLGAIIVIAIFYSNGLSFLDLSISLGIISLLFLLNKLRVHPLLFYLIGGLVAWYFMLHSGIHSTIAGVLVAFAIPIERPDKPSPASTLEHALHAPVSFFILPLFALANTCVAIGGDWVQGLLQPSGLGILLGLCLGKPIGIAGFSLLAIAIGISAFPNNIHWRNIIGIGFLGGIGFTMSIFISMIAFENPQLANNARLAILVASCFSGILGFLFLKTKPVGRRLIVKSSISMRKRGTRRA